jgi:hypothetical protein
VYAATSSGISRESWNSSTEVAVNGLHWSLRRRLTAAENALVPDREVDAALARAQAGQAPRSRVEIAGLRVFRSPVTSHVPPLESRPLHRSRLRRLLHVVPARSGTAVDPYPSSPASDVGYARTG